MIMFLPKKSISAVPSALFVLVSLLSCAVTVDMRKAPAAEPVVAVERSTGLTGIQEALVESAYWARGRSDLSNNGKSFNTDCSGMVSALYWRAGLDIQSCYPRYTGNGVTRIYRWMDDESLLYRPDEPVPGDIIFWDNSYDRNGNGLADDELTHIGMVVSVDEAGVVTYVHHDYLSGVIFARMYPPDPSDRSRNSGMRMQSLGPTPEGGITSGDLYRDAGRAWEIPER